LSRLNGWRGSCVLFCHACDAVAPGAAAPGAAAAAAAAVVAVLHGSKSQRGVFWAVGRESPSAVDFLLGNNTRHWANTSLPVSEMTRGILQCCNSVAINRSGHLLADYHNATQSQLRPGAFAPFQQRDVDVFVDIGAAEGAGGLNCSNVPQSGSPNSTCVTPAQICQAALLRKEAFAAEVLALTMDHKLSGVTVDWEFNTGTIRPALLRYGATCLVCCRCIKRRLRRL